MTRRQALRVLGVTPFINIARSQSGTPRPNIVLFLLDDAGYDFGCFGSSIKTPYINSIAAQGMKFTRFYPGAASVCTPNRAAILTGRYPLRTGVAAISRVLQQGDTDGLPNVPTLASLLKELAGYKTFYVGKWHLGNEDAQSPEAHGFGQSYYLKGSSNFVPRDIYRGNIAVENYSAQPGMLTTRFTDETESILDRQNSQEPFFLLLAHTAPHTPTNLPPNFQRTEPGDYLNLIRHLDDQIGRVLTKLREKGLEQNTVVIFCSDNGPAADGDGRTPFRGRKGDSYEGGIRTPLLIKWPGGKIPAGRAYHGMTCGMDFIPTILTIIEQSFDPAMFDGVNILPILRGEVPQVQRPGLVIFNGQDPECIVTEEYKLQRSRDRKPYYWRRVYRMQGLKPSEIEAWNIAMDDDLDAQDPTVRSVILNHQKQMDAILSTFPEGMVVMSKESP